jgi:uncharacterized membrane protein
MRLVPVFVSVLGALAVAVWLGGLLVLGAVVAPIVFANVSFPQSADAMTLVFRRFDMVAMTCAAVAMAAEAAKVAVRTPFGRLDHLRAGLTVVAAVLAVVEGTLVSPRIAALHQAGVMRGMGAAGETLSHLHDMAETLGKTEVVLLAIVLGLVVAAPIRGARERMP